VLVTLLRSSSLAERTVPVPMPAPSRREAQVIGAAAA
jgi:hypothetical protein